MRFGPKTAVLLAAFALAGASCGPVPGGGPGGNGGGGTTTTPGDDAVPCPDSVDFPDLSDTPGAGSGYAAPDVTVSCTETLLNVSSNGMISYEFDQKTPNALAEQAWNWSVPLEPTVAATPTSILNTLGTLGFTVTGLPIYGPTEGPFPPAEAFGDPEYNGILDSCGGHTGPASEYHDHAVISTSDCGFEASPIVGYALDGFPIYGPNGCLDLACENVVEMTSGYEQTGNPTSNAWTAYTYVGGSEPGMLDECNGTYGPDGTYRYHATSGFPYTFGCFKGTPVTQSGSAGAPLAPGS